MRHIAFSRTPVGALFEIFIAALMCFFILFLIQFSLEAVYIYQISSLILAGCSAAFALRLQPWRGNLLQQMGQELGTAIVFTAGLDNIFLGFAVLAVQSRNIDNTIIVAETLVKIVNYASLSLPFLTYILLRIAMLNFQDQLRAE